MRKMGLVQHFAPVNHFACVISHAGKVLKVFLTLCMFRNINRCMMKAFLANQSSKFQTCLQV